MKKSKEDLTVEESFLKHLGIKFDEPVGLEFPLFSVHRFGVKKINVRENPFNSPVHVYLVYGELYERIVVCLIENLSGGSIETIKIWKSGKMDSELGTLIAKGTCQKLSENYDFKLI